MSIALLIDFGSTYTKLRAIDIDAGTVVASGQAPSTVTSDITIGLDAALAELESQMGGLPRFRHRLACSSAAGGLRMVTVGLVPDLTAMAARQAALGAGAKLVGTFSFELTERDVNDIVSVAPDIILLSGGTDGGNHQVIAHNAQRLAESTLTCPVVVAGNRSVSDTVAGDLRKAGKQAVVTGNVMPRHLELDIEPARKAIRQLFIEHIVHAKGIDKASARFDTVLMPTPAAVLQGAQCLADGVDGEPGLGPLMVVDIGGSTTDVYSLCDGKPSHSGVVYHGLPEPYAKRTVEGDLGMRHSARSVAAEVGRDAFVTEVGLNADAVERLLLRSDDNLAWLPRGGDEQQFDQALAYCATRLSVSRHAGTHETVYTATGPVTLQRGKDLSEVATIIGTGGVLVHSDDPTRILSAALARENRPLSLMPRTARLLLDADYVLYACGLLGAAEPAAALVFARNALKLFDGERTEEGSKA